MEINKMAASCCSFSDGITLVRPESKWSRKKKNTLAFDLLLNILRSTGIHEILGYVYGYLLGVVDLTLHVNVNSSPNVLKTIDFVSSLATRQFSSAKLKLD